MASHRAARDSIPLTPIPLDPHRSHGHPNLSHARHLKWLPEIVSQWDGRNVDVGIVGIPYDGHARAPFHGTAHGPEGVRDVLYSQYTTYNSDLDVDLSGLSIADCGNVSIQDSYDKNGSHGLIEAATSELFASANVLVMIGGDSDATIPIARALIRPETDKVPVGVVVFESHYDNRDMEQGFERGGSDFVRQLMNEPVPIRGSNIVFIGIHGFLYSAYDAAYAVDAGNTVFRARDMRAMGARSVALKSLEAVTRSTDCFYVHLGIDSIDQSFIPGTGLNGFGSFVGGLTPWDIAECLTEFGKDPRCRGLYIASINPLADFNKMLMKISADMVMQFLTGVAQRKGR